MSDHFSLTENVAILGYLDGRNWLTGERSIAAPYLFVILRWAINTQVGLQGFENLSPFVDRMNLDAGVRAALATEAESKPS